MLAQEIKIIWSGLKLRAYNTLQYSLGAIEYFFNREPNKGTADKDLQSDSILILGTGPSLKNLNHKIFAHIDTFAVNAYARLVSKNGWPEPDYYAIQDLEVFRKLSSDIADLKKARVFTSSVLYSAASTRELLLPSYKKFRHHLLNHAYVKEYEDLNLKKSKFGNFLIFDGYTVVYSAMQIAYEMGYRNIYLLGVDANYSDNISKRNLVDIGKRDHTFKSAGERIIFAIKFFNRNYPDANLYNCSKDGALTFLEFRELHNCEKIVS